MGNQRTLLFLLCLLLIQIYLPAQEKSNAKFGKISPADFNQSVAAIDSGADAVILADIGSTEFEGNRKGRGRFSMVFRRYKRIRILNKNAFDAADVRINVYSDGDAEESLTELKASTYNLEGGKVVETKLDGKSIFTEKISKLESTKKFTLPAVREGSILEIAYTIKSDFFQYLRSWTFEGRYPCHWSEYNVRVPEFFVYTMRSQGDQHFLVKTSDEEKGMYSIRVSGGAESNDEVSYIETHDVVAHWVKKDVPAFRMEPYTTTIDNYVSRIEFQLNYIQYSITSQRINYLDSWSTLIEKLLKSEYFGAALEKENNWMGDELKTITAGCSDKGEKLARIYGYVRDHFTCTDHDALQIVKPLKNVFRDKSGNVAEINLLLVAMLRHEEIDASPVVLSTRENGVISQNYPMLDKLNYVICLARYESGSYLLDASWPELGFNHLPQSCYNGEAHVIDPQRPVTLDLNPDSLKEMTNTSVLIINDDRGFPSGTFNQLPGYYASCAIRENVRKNGLKEYFKAVQTGYGSSLELENPAVDSLDKKEFPLQVHYDFDLKSYGHENMIYFDPMLAEQWKENPFKAAERRYPVEMPHRMDEVYTFTMDIPEGYTVEELPKSVRTAYNENEGLFEYLIQKNESAIQLRTHIKLNKTSFSPEEYTTLRDFFAFVVKKESEQIVFKKK